VFFKQVALNDLKNYLGDTRFPIDKKAKLMTSGFVQYLNKPQKVMMHIGEYSGQRNFRTNLCNESRISQSTN
jgi:hypothetical protein